MPVIVSCDVGTKNLALCIIKTSKDFDNSHILGMDLLQITKETSFCCKLLSETLEKLQQWYISHQQFFFDEIVHFVIERQPNRSYLMSMVMSSVLTWAYCNFNGGSFNIANPKHKLGFVHFPKSLSYQNRKKKAVEIALKMTSSSPWHAVIQSHKKKDDICDCLLQGLYYLEGNFACKVLLPLIGP